MSLNARMSEADPRLYNPTRDVAHCFGDVMREVAGRLEDQRWSALADWLKAEGVTQDDLGEACRAACLFVASAMDDKQEGMAACLTRCGFFDVKEPAQAALCAIMGTVMLGYFWSGVHEVTIGGSGPCQTYQDLREAGERSARLIAMPRYRKWWLKTRLRLSGAWAALFAKK